MATDDFSEYNVKWSHDKISRVGPSRWYREFPICSKGKLQSPINIRQAQEKIVTNASKLVLVNFKMAPNSLTIKNAEDSLYVYFNFNDPNNVPQITGGPLGDSRFNFTSMNIRWRSGHMIESRHFEAELVLNFNGNVKVSLLMKVAEILFNLQMFTFVQINNKYFFFTLS